MRSIEASRRPCVFRDERDVDGMRQKHPARLDSATTLCNGEIGPGRVHWTERGRVGNGTLRRSVPAEPRRFGRFERSVGTRQQF